MASVRANHRKRAPDKVIRGIFSNHFFGGSDPAWDRVKTFETKEECEAWFAAVKRSTNPDYPACQQIYTTLVDWAQVYMYLLRPLAKLGAPSYTGDGFEPSPDNLFAKCQTVVDGLMKRFNSPIHMSTSDSSTLHSLRYLFFHMRCGIFVAIRQRRVDMFVPFVNKDYTNTWGDVFKIEGDSIEEYYRRKKAMGGPREDVIPEMEKWWANGNIVCNVVAPNYWGDAYLPQMKDMLQRVCMERNIPDCDFFINKRDHPHLKLNVTEPFDFIGSKSDEPLTREKHASYTPIMSFFCSDHYADIPIPNTDDWETATGLVYPPKGNDIRSVKKRQQFHVNWADKVATAVFRGNSTGPGTLPETNQRLHLAKLTAEWARNDLYNERNPIDGIPYLDAGVVGWNWRDRKLQGRPMAHIRPRSLPFERSERIPMYEQVKYKYLIYAEGHCAAARYASMMVLGSVIIKIESTVTADMMWYFPILKPLDRFNEATWAGADHISVKADLSDLADVLTWCKQHDKECKAMASNAEMLAKAMLHEKGQLDYMALVLKNVAKRYVSTPRLIAKFKSLAEEKKKAKEKAEDEAGGFAAALRLANAADKGEEKTDGQEGSLKMKYFADEAPVDLYGFHNKDYCMLIDSRDRPQPHLIGFEHECGCARCRVEAAEERKNDGARRALLEAKEAASARSVGIGAMARARKEAFQQQAFQQALARRRRAAVAGTEAATSDAPAPLSSRPAPLSANPAAAPRRKSKSFMEALKKRRLAAMASEAKRPRQ